MDTFYQKKLAEEINQNLNLSRASLIKRKYKRDLNSFVVHGAKQVNSLPPKSHKKLARI